MEFGTAELVCAILIVSKDPQRLVTFYREVRGIPLKAEEHSGVELPK